MRPSPLIVAVTALSLACGQGRELTPEVPGVAIGLSLGGADASVDADDHARELAYLHALIERSRQAAAAAPDASAGPARPRDFDPLNVAISIAVPPAAQPAAALPVEPVAEPPATPLPAITQARALAPPPPVAARGVDDEQAQRAAEDALRAEQARRAAEAAQRAAEEARRAEQARHDGALEHGVHGARGGEGVGQPHGARRAARVALVSIGVCEQQR